MTRAMLGIMPFLLAAGACAGDAMGTGVRWATEFQYMRRGGLCASPAGGGGCDLVVTVKDDGSWSATGLPDGPAEGELPLGVASELAAIFDNSWRPFTDVAFTGTCPTAYDGQEYGYRVRQIPYGPGAELADARVREVWSCIYDLERYDCLVKRNMIEEAWKAVKPPELAHVEFR